MSQSSEALFYKMTELVDQLTRLTKLAVELAEKELADVREREAYKESQNSGSIRA